MQRRGEERRGEEKVEGRRWEEIKFLSYSTVTSSGLYQLHLITVHTNIIIIIKQNSEFNMKVLTVKLISELDGTQFLKGMCVVVRLSDTNLPVTAVNLLGKNNST